MADDSTIEAQVRDCEAHLYQAMEASNVAELDALIADDLVFVGPDGSLATKALDLELHRNGAVKFQRFVPKDLRIQPMNGFALAYARIFLSGTFLEQPFEGDFQYTRVWIWRDGRWQIVSGSVTPVHAGSA